MKRREFLSTLALAGVASQLPRWLSAAEPASKPNRPPNFLFILTDDQGYGDLGRHGHPLLRTPNLDRLHDESVRFSNFYVSPSCSPTRAALLTGMHEFKSGVTHTIVPREHLALDSVILPQLLRQAGYATAVIGKWHLSGDKGYAPTDRGFDWYSTNVGGPANHFSPDMIRNGVRSKAEGFREDLYFDDAITFMEQNKDRPFFCNIATFSPHTPLGAPEELIAHYRDKVDEETATYLAMIENIDANVGRILNYLEKSGLADNTVVIFMNDNGVTMGLDTYNADMRGCKCTIWQGGSRAMSFWRLPGKWQPHVADNLTAHLDVLPTICELAGAPIPESLRPKLDGFSLRTLLEARGPAAWHDDRLLYQHVARWPSGMAAAHQYAMAAVRQGDYLLLRSEPCDDDAQCGQYVSQCDTLREVEKGQTQAVYTKANAQYHWGVTPRDHWALFDSRQDPGCQKDLAAEKPELAAKLAGSYDKWWAEVYPIMMKNGGDAGKPWVKGEKPPN